MSASDDLQQLEAEETARAQAELAGAAGTAQLPPEPNPEPITAPVAASDDPWRSRAKPEWAALKESASVTAAVGWLFIFGGAVCALWVVGRVAEDKSPAIALAASGGLFSLGCFLHLVAQLLYIRSTLERAEWFKD